MSRTQVRAELPRRVSRQGALLRLGSIERELQESTEARAELWRRSAREEDPRLARKAGELSKRIDDLWTTYRWLRSVISHGSPERIRTRARREEHLLRELPGERA